jgi:general secretion pathway protein G
MICISIIIILALIVLPKYNETVLAAKEATLRDDLHQMRKLIDQYAADKGRLPQSLDDLVTSGYLGRIPPDPITGQPDWALQFGEDPNAPDGGQGLANVCSSSNEQASDGSTYSDCEKW